MIVFPGATGFLTLFSLLAYSSADLGSLPLLVLSAYAFYFLFYTLAQRLPLYAGAVVTPLASLLFFMSVYYQYETGSLLPGDALTSDLYTYTRTAVPGGLIRYPLFLTAIYPLLLILYFALQPRLLRFRRGFNLDLLPVKVALAAALVLLFVLPPSHFPHFAGSAWRSASLASQLEESDLVRAGRSLRPLIAMPRWNYPVADYPFLRLPPSLETEGELNTAAFMSAWEEDRLKSVQAESPPNVFLILLDDFNGLYRGRAEGGRALTPVLDGLYARGLGADRFYSTGTGHLRGAFSTLCGVPASFLAPTAVAYPENFSYCLPRVLNYLGYSTYFLNDAPRANLHNALIFMKRIGFEQVFFRIGADAEKASPERGLSWSGDAAYYRNVFQFLQQGGATEPFFVTVAVHEHSYPFRDEKGETLRDGGNPAEKRARYLTSLRRADAALGVFFEELAASPFGQNSLVAVVGSQGFPTGEHGHFHDGRGLGDENLRTVFVLTGREAARVQVPASQVDVAPTLLRALKISAPGHFTGRELQTAIRADRPVYFSQAADGKYWGFVAYPYKYVFHVKTGDEQVYHLGDDPGETKPLDPVAQKAVYESLRKRIGLLPLNQAVLLRNRLWPIEDVR